MAETDDNDLRGSTPVMSAKELLVDLWKDMKIVRPQVDNLVRADLPTRVKALEDRNMIEDAATRERGRLFGLGNRGFLIVFGTIQSALGILGVLVATGRIHV